MAVAHKGSISMGLVLIAAVPKQVPKVSLDKNELDMAKMLVDNMTRPFVPEGFRTDMVPEDLDE